MSRDSRSLFFREVELRGSSREKHRKGREIPIREVPILEKMAAEKPILAVAHVGGNPVLFPRSDQGKRGLFY